MSKANVFTLEDLIDQGYTPEQIVQLIADIEAAEVVSVEYYNLQGVRVEGGARGTLIRVSTDANGSRKAEKVIVR